MADDALRSCSFPLDGHVAQVQPGGFADVVQMPMPMLRKASRKMTQDEKAEMREKVCRMFVLDFERWTDRFFVGEVGHLR